MTRTLPELVARHQPVTPDTEHVIRRCAAAFYAYTERPRYFLSPGYLAAQPTVFTWGIVDDCLVLLKRRYIVGNRVMYLVMPPLHPAGDAQAERRVIDEFRALHVGTMLSAEDVARYGYPEREVKLDHRWPEYSYRASAWADLSGRHNRQIRSMVNQTSRLEAEGKLSVAQGPAAYYEHDLQDLARRWHAQRGLDVHQAKLVRTLQDHARRGTSLRWAHVILDESGRAVAHSLTEQIVPGQVIIVSRIRDYEWDLLPDPVLLLHAADCAAWVNLSGEPECVLTSGSARTAGLTGHKAKLRPAWVTPVGRLSTERALTKEEYDAAVPGGIPAGVPRGVGPADPAVQLALDF